MLKSLCYLENFNNILEIKIIISKGFKLYVSDCIKVSASFMISENFAMIISYKCFSIIFSLMLFNMKRPSIKVS